jgi:hypothetical protein
MENWHPIAIYVGYAIDQAGESVLEVETRIKQALGKSDLPLIAYFPRAPFFIQQKDELGSKWGFVREVNEAVIAAADGCLFLSSGGFSFGMPLEVDLVSRLGKPWLFVDESQKEIGGYLTALASRDNYGVVSTNLLCVPSWLEEVAHNVGQKRTRQCNTK